ncbi:MAG: hypothetical protein JNJ83_11890 [Verrucomicrobiaceae bacterium]|nr:hypothetical protein [Verrucomicrobiaceae bacterium]
MSALKKLGLILLAFGLVLLLAAVLGRGLGLRALSAIGALLSLGYGAHAFVKGGSGSSVGEWAVGCYRFAAAQVFNFSLLFILVNILCWLLPKPAPLDVNLRELFHDPVHLFSDNPDFLRQKIYPGLTDADIQELINPPSSSHHPTLEYVAPLISTKHYQTGLEGVRLDQSLDPAQLATFLKDGSVWLFGGSTMFGANLPGDQTVSAHLNQLDKPRHYLNFGVPSYNQNLEINKLLLLLRKGFKPKRVIFLDGWNDFTSLRSSDFHPVEMPAKSIHAYSAAYSIERFISGSGLGIVRKLPVIDSLIRWQEGNMPPPEPTLTAEGHEDLFNAKSAYHQQPSRHFQFVRTRQFDHAAFLKDIERQKQRLETYYTANDDFLGKLAAAYGFDVHVFLQPMGSLSEQNPFLKEGVQLTTHPYYLSTKALMDSARQLVTSGKLKHFHDIVEPAPITKTGYVDAAHYNSAACQAIAKAILQKLPPLP